MVHPKAKETRGKSNGRRTDRVVKGDTFRHRAHHPTEDANPRARLWDPAGGDKFARLLDRPGTHFVREVYGGQSDKDAKSATQRYAGGTAST